MDITILDTATNVKIALPLPIMDAMAESFDGYGYKSIGIKTEEAPLIAEILTNANLEISELNALAILLDSMDSDGLKRYAAAAAAFLPIFVSLPSAFVVLAKAVDDVYICTGCDSYIKLGKMRLANAPEQHSSLDEFREGLRFANENIVAFYEGAAVILSSEAFNNAEKSLLSSKVENCSKTE